MVDARHQRDVPRDEEALLAEGSHPPFVHAAGRLHVQLQGISGKGLQHVDLGKEDSEAPAAKLLLCLHAVDDVCDPGLPRWNVEMSHLQPCAAEAATTAPEIATAVSLFGGF